MQSLVEVEVALSEKTLHELEVEFVAWKAQQEHLLKTVDVMHDEMKEVRKAVFQAKWMLAGALVVGGLMSSETAISLLLAASP